jgi:hypothetical protein
MVNQVFDKGDFLKVRRAHQQLAPAIAAIDISRNTLSVLSPLGGDYFWCTPSVKR